MRVAGDYPVGIKGGAFARATNLLEGAMIKKRGVPGDEDFEAIPDDELDDLSDDGEGDDDELIDDDFDDELEDDEDFGDEFDEETYDEDDDLDEVEAEDGDDKEK